MVRIVVGPVLVGARGACWRKAIWALIWHHGGCFAITFAHANWTRKWTGYGGRKTGRIGAVFNGRQWKRG